MCWKLSGKNETLSNMVSSQKCRQQHYYICKSLSCCIQWIQFELLFRVILPFLHMHGITCRLLSSHCLLMIFTHDIIHNFKEKNFLKLRLTLSAVFLPTDWIHIAYGVPSVHLWIPLRHYFFVTIFFFFFFFFFNRGIEI